MFSAGKPLGPDLMLACLRGEKIDWPSVREKMKGSTKPESSGQLILHCSVCGPQDKDKFNAAQLKQGAQRKCEDCAQDDRCNRCEVWKPKAAFSEFQKRKKRRFVMSAAESDSA